MNLFVVTSVLRPPYLWIDEGWGRVLRICENDGEGLHFLGTVPPVHRGGLRVCDMMVSRVLLIDLS